jgi:sulfate-transporting ATPase
VAENEVAASALGWSPDLIATVNWAVGSAIAAVAGVLIIPLTGLNVTILILLIVPTFASALVGGFTSFPLTLAAPSWLCRGMTMFSLLSRGVLVDPV